MGFCFSPVKKKKKVCRSCELQSIHGALWLNGQKTELEIEKFETDIQKETQNVIFQKRTIPKGARKISQVELVC